jgi:archaeal chaperonin
MTNQMQPIFILPEDTQRNTGKDAQRNNIAAAKAVADAVRTTLGPKGMDKMIVDESGHTIITNDGATILTEMQIEHPAAKMVVDVAKNQEQNVGDGTTSAVILAGELLKQAESLLDLSIHPTMIAKGYHLAGIEAQRILHTLARDISITNTLLLKQIAVTAMTGKGAESNKEVLAEIVVKAITTIAEPNTNNNNNNNNNTHIVDLNNIKVESIIGEAINKSELIRGIVLDKERVHPGMPTKIYNPRIALLNTPLEIRNTEIDAKIQITNPDQLNSFLEQEETYLKNMVEKIKMSGANVVICQKGIDEIAQHFLANEKILAVRRVRKSDMEKLARATGATILNSYKDLTQEHLGTAGIVREEKHNDTEMLYIEECPNPKSITILIRGGTEHVALEIKRSVEDALGDLAATLRCGKVVAGAGATEILLAKQLKEYSAHLQGREQLAVIAFSDALEIIPRTLAENAGMDPIDVLTLLKSSQLEWPGINVFSGLVMNSWDCGVIEPLTIKTQALESAVQVAQMLLRIDDVIISSKNSSQNSMPHMPPHGNMM